MEVSPSNAEGSGNLQQQLKLQLPTGLHRGSVQIEVASGGFISQAQVCIGPACFAQFLTVDPESLW